MTEDPSGWIVFPLGMLAGTLFISTLWLLKKSDEADEADVPKTRTLSISRGLVVLSWIVAPTLGIFDPDGIFWEWVGRINGIMFVIAFPIWVSAERRRGTIRTRWESEHRPSARPEEPREVE